MDRDFELTPAALLKSRDRRARRRYPIELPAELTSSRKRVEGKTVNISTSGLLLACPNPELRIGTRVKVRIGDWPLQRRKNGMLALIVEGHIVRSSDGKVAVRRLRYYFAEV